MSIETFAPAIVNDEATMVEHPKGGWVWVHDYRRAEARVTALQSDLAEARKYSERLEMALSALDTAAQSAVRENDNPNRVVFKDGFVIEGRLADEWLNFMRLIREVAARAILSKVTP